MITLAYLVFMNERHTWPHPETLLAALMADLFFLLLLLTP